MVIAAIIFAAVMLVAVCAAAIFLLTDGPKPTKETLGTPAGLDPVEEVPPEEQAELMKQFLQDAEESDMSDIVFDDTPYAEAEYDALQR